MRLALSWTPSTGKEEEGTHGLLHTYCVPGTMVGGLCDAHPESSQLKNELDIIIICIIQKEELRPRECHSP